MKKFKRVLVFNAGDVLKTSKGELTDWTFISESHSNPTTGRRHVNARCKCGKEKVICINNVRCGNSTCCGLSPCRGTERDKDVEVGHRAILYVYKKHAKDRGFTFDLDYDYFKELTKGNCHYCGIEPVQVYQLKNPKTGKIRSGVPVYYNGIDRVDSSKGYTKENVVTCCKVCNRAKSNMSLEDFKNWIMKVHLITIKKLTVCPTL
jgi:hypothetical protein